ncbi:MAG: ubiquinone biosynthesis regulatory protein kinase UbiB [Thiotrichales bacterium]|nr:ubiquinone biosynthesis regulatory protein kinase UbiB [Thiotrichales bacterium]
MIGLRQILRLVTINVVLVRHGLDEIVLRTHLLRPVRFVLYLLPWNWVRRTQPPRAVRLRRALEDLGPIFIKFGQLLSTRRDLLQEDIADELASLQDRVPPFPGDKAAAIVRQELGRPVEEIFSEFVREPLASASIAQVHAARLADGREVVVKVVRPEIEKTIRRDVSLLRLVAELAHRYWPAVRRLNPREVVAEYEKTIIDELDLLREAASASQLRRNFEGSDLLHVPEVHWEYTRRRVMVMERISGIPVSNVDALVDAGVDLRVLAERGVEIFFTQLTHHNFFHADMHPGNIFVDRTHPARPSYIAVDFGIMGSLSDQDQRYLAENLLAFFNRDYRRVAELHVESRWVPADTRIDEFEAAIRAVCEPIFDRPLKEISFGRVLVQLFSTTRRFHMEVQPQLVLLQKTLLNIEGLGRQLYPELDLWETAKPFLERWIRGKIGTRGLIRELGRQAPRWGETLPALPGIAYETMKLVRSGRIEVSIRSDALDGLRTEMRRGNRRIVQAVIGTALIIAASVVLSLGTQHLASLWGAPIWTWVLGGAGGCLVLAALLDGD